MTMRVNGYLNTEGWCETGKLNSEERVYDWFYTESCFPLCLSVTRQACGETWEGAGAGHWATSSTVGGMIGGARVAVQGVLGRYRESLPMGAGHMSTAQTRRLDGSETR